MRMTLLLIKQFIKLLFSPLPMKNLFIDMVNSPCYQLDTSNDPYHGNLMWFMKKVNERGDGRLLEIGSRSSLVKPHLRCGEYIGFDIRPGKAVDIVGDVHHLSEKLQHGYFDFVFCLSSFEHFAMPWKAVLEINKIMKNEGILCVGTHPAWPPHEVPWDFWRFSKESFKVLLNDYTGFEIIQCDEGLPASIVPFSTDVSMTNMHKHLTPLGVSVVARKVGPAASHLSWNVSIPEILDTTYPTIKWDARPQ